MQDFLFKIYLEFEDANSRRLNQVWSLTVCHMFHAYEASRPVLRSC